MANYFRNENLKKLKTKNNENLISLLTNSLNDKNLYNFIINFLIFIIFPFVFTLSYF